MSTQTNTSVSCDQQKVLIRGDNGFIIYMRAATLQLVHGVQPSKLPGKRQAGSNQSSDGKSGICNSKAYGLNPTAAATYS